MYGITPKANIENLLKESPVIALAKSPKFIFFNDVMPGTGIVVKDLEQFTKNHEEEVFCIGGKMVYGMMLPYADRLYITRINKEYEGDVFFPEYDESAFELISSVDNGDLTFEIYERKK